MNFKNYIYISIIFISLLSVTNTKAQDVLFDQYYKAPTYLNPALTGVINGNYRLSGLYHNQWASQLNSGINASFASGDVKFERKTKNGGFDFWGLGLSFLNDKYNEFNLSTRTLSINTSYHKLLGEKAKQYLGIGLQLGINQRNIDYENLSFEDQFNQIDAYNLETGELLPQNNFGHLGLSTGIFYSSQPSDKLYYNLGISYSNINSTNISLYKEEKNPVAGLEQYNRLYSKINIHAVAYLGLTENLYLVPDVLFSKQGPYQSILLGTRLKLNLNFEDPNNAVTIGLRGKLSKVIDKTNISSILFLTDYKFKDLIIGFSYNLMLQPIVVSNLSYNIFELSLKYTGEYNNDEYYCPEF